MSIKHAAAAFALFALVCIGFSPAVQSFRFAARGAPDTSGYADSRPAAPWLGKFVRLRPTGLEHFDAVYANGVMPLLRLSNTGGSRFLYGTPSLRTTSLQGRIAALSHLPGAVSFEIGKNGRTLASLSPSRVMSVASAYKLAIAAALQDRVRRHRAAWDAVTALQARWIAPPTGVLRNLPPSTPLTTSQLALDLIAESDNTAADALTEIVGREAIGRLMPDEPHPLTPKELFLLRSDRYDRARLAYERGTQGTRRALLAGIDADLRPPQPIGLQRFDPAIEWHMSAAQLCRVMQSVHALSFVWTNPGVADPREWQSIAYKGGDDNGVDTMVTYAQRNGNTFCFAAIWNGVPGTVPFPAFASYYADVLDKLDSTGKGHKP